MKKAISLFMLACLVASCHAQQAEKATVTMYFFWGQGCPHCEEMKPFVQEMDDKYPQLVVKSFETFNDPASNQLYKSLAKAYGETAEGVPASFIGDKMIIGYAKGETDVQVKAAIEDCIKNGCPDPDQKLDQYLKENPTTTSTLIPGYVPPAADPMVMGFGALVVAVLLALLIKNRKQLM